MALAERKYPRCYDQKGYKVIDIEIDDGAYEVELTDKNGVRVEGHVHPETGELLLGYDDD